MKWFTSLLITIFLWSPLYGQEKTSPGDYRIPSAHSLLPGFDRELALLQTQHKNEIFRIVQESVASGEMSELLRNIGSHVYLNIRGVESGYYSANQAQFVLQNYFNLHKPLSFSFTSYGESGGSPFATGRGSINVKGNREFIQVYVLLSRQKDRWIISQFNIY